MLSAERLPQVRAEACISLQASWEQVNSSNCPNHVWRTKSSIKKRIIVRRTVRSMFGVQTFAQLRTGLRNLSGIGREVDLKMSCFFSLLMTQVASGPSVSGWNQLCFLEEQGCFSGTNNSSVPSFTGHWVLYNHVSFKHHTVGKMPCWKCIQGTGIGWCQCQASRV